MTFREAEELVAEWGAVLCPEYEIEVVEGFAPDAAENEQHAAITKPAGYLRATLYLGDITVDGIGPERARHLLLHELLHLTLVDLEHAATEPTNALSYDAGRLAQENIERYIERTVDRLASAFESVSA